ncbi:MAG TPA: lytic transglycosylase domain-containing protein [Rudaea sp.]|nr:lytic transglycosylase domain-containing protein [Rudaea sp.]
MSDTWLIKLVWELKLGLSRLPPLRYLCLFGVAVLALAPLGARAGAVYKCTGPDGQIAFTNTIGTFTHCHKVAQYADQQVSKAKPAPAAPVKPHSEYLSQPPVANSGAITSTDTTAAAAKPEIHRGAVYKVVKVDGITEYTNVRPHHGAYKVLFTYISTCYACNVDSNVDWRNTPLNLTAYHDEIADAAQQYGVDPDLLRAVIHAESAFNPNALSDKGAQGLMQLMPGTASDLGVDNPFDAAQNIRGGAHYLSGLLKQFGGDERRATAAYNAGPQNVQKYGGVPPFDETRVYVQRVATLLKRYREANHATLAGTVAVDPPKS